LIAALGKKGGNPSRKLSRLRECILQKLRKEVGLQVLYSQRGNRRTSLPEDIVEALTKGTYRENLVRKYGEAEFPLHEVVLLPTHTLVLKLKIQTGGRYWTGVVEDDSVEIPIWRENFDMFDSDMDAAANHNFESQSGQRGLSLQWGWQQRECSFSNDLPQWLLPVLEEGEGTDPIAKMSSKIESIARWRAHRQDDEHRLLTGDGSRVNSEWPDELRILFKTWPEMAPDKLKQIVILPSLEDVQDLLGEHIVHDEMIDELHGYRMRVTLIVMSPHAVPEKTRAHLEPGDVLVHHSTSWGWIDEEAEAKAAVVKAAKAKAKAAAGRPPPPPAGDQATPGGKAPPPPKRAPPPSPSREDLNACEEPRSKEVAAVEAPKPGKNARLFETDSRSSSRLMAGSPEGKLQRQMRLAAHPPKGKVAAKPSQGELRL